MYSEELQCEEGHLFCSMHRQAASGSPDFWSGTQLKHSKCDLAWSWRPLNVDSYLGASCMLVPILVNYNLIHTRNIRGWCGRTWNTNKNGQNECLSKILPFPLAFCIVSGLKTCSRDTDMQVKLISFLCASLLSFMCFLISSFAIQMCFHNGYANIMYVFPAATQLMPNKLPLLLEQMCLMATPQLSMIKLGVEEGSNSGGLQE